MTQTCPVPWCWALVPETNILCTEHQVLVTDDTLKRCLDLRRTAPYSAYYFAMRDQAILEVEVAVLEREGKVELELVDRRIAKEE